MTYTPAVNIFELIKQEEVMEHFGLGPNGALIYCMEFLETNIKWLITKVLNLKDYYLIFDCPGQVSYVFRIVYHAIFFYFISNIVREI